VREQAESYRKRPPSILSTCARPQRSPTLTRAHARANTPPHCATKGRTCTMRTPLSPCTRLGFRSICLWPCPSVPLSFQPQDHSWPSASIASVLRLPAMRGVPGKPRLRGRWLVRVREVGVGWVLDWCVSAVL